MSNSNQSKNLRQRTAALDMAPEEFRRAGHQLVDQIADFLNALPEKRVTLNTSQTEIRKKLGLDTLPDAGTPATELLEGAAHLLFEHSLFNGHPRFWGYITSSAAPIGALAEMLAATINPNVGAWTLSPVASEIEAQTVRWIAEMLNYPVNCGGLLVSGGNMANFVCFLAGRAAKSNSEVGTKGLFAGDAQLRVYASSETHTWIQKAADLFGLGTNAINWVPVDSKQRMRIDLLEQKIVEDREAGYFPFLVVGTAGSVSTGVIDPLAQIGEVCRKYDLWFHVDGAYGALAAMVPDAPQDLKGMAEADSIAVDPHKWLYSPLEAGCVLVRGPQHLVDAFSFHPDYYNFSEEDGAPVNYYEIGPQNSRGFRALKVWLAIRHAGKSGYIKMIQDDISLARALHKLVESNPELQALSQNLSITAFRYLPQELRPTDSATEAYINELNETILERLQTGGQAYLSNAVINGKFALRACIVNFRTTLDDIEVLPGLVVELGRKLHAEMRETSW